MRSAPKAGAADCHALDAWLRGIIAPPLRSEPITDTLRFTCVERLGRITLRAREIYDRGVVADHELACAWHSACRIVIDFERTAKRRTAAAEEIAAVQMRALHELCSARAEALHGRALVWDEDTPSLRLVDEWRLLSGILALSLMETGDMYGRRDVREAAAEGMDNDDGADAAAGYVRVLLGLSGYPSEETWRPGQGCLGVLANAFKDGQKSLMGVLPDVLKQDAGTGHGMHSKAASARLRALQDVEPEPVPAKVDAGPSLLVLASVEHLPGGAEDGRDKPGRATGSTARSEYAPIASRRLPLAVVPDLAAAQATLAGEFPDAAPLIERILRDLVGRPHVLLRPILLVGPPGSGKTRLARRIAEVLGLAVTVHGCAGVADGAFIGTSRQWSTGRASVPMQAIKRALSASVAIVLDEIEKAGTRRDNGSLHDGILPLLEPEGARRFHDLYLETETDLSAVSYLATANSLTGMPAPLLDRFRIFEMPEPSLASMPVLARGIVAEVRQDRGLDKHWMPDLDGDELGLVAGHWQGGSVRLLRRLVETVLAGRETLTARH